MRHGAFEFVCLGLSCPWSLKDGHHLHGLAHGRSRRPHFPSLSVVPGVEQIYSSAALGSRRICMLPQAQGYIEDSDV